MSKVRATRDGGKITWLYKGKVVIAYFGPHFKIEQLVGIKEVAANSLIGNYAKRSIWANTDEDSTLSRVRQNKHKSSPT